VSYLVEQPPYCDLLRLSPATGRFVLPEKDTIYSGLQKRLGLSLFSSPFPPYYLAELSRGRRGTGLGFFGGGWPCRGRRDRHCGEGARFLSGKARCGGESGARTRKWVLWCRGDGGPGQLRGSPRYWTFWPKKAPVRAFPANSGDGHDSAEDGMRVPG
jgi:hypothetical protein